MKDGNSGYKVHLQRILYSGGAITRAFKFPLIQNCQARDYNAVPNSLIEAIKHDDLYIRGPVNLNDYLDPNKRQVYTIIQFWVDSLKAGVIWMPKAGELVKFVNQIYGINPAEKIWKEARPEIRKFFAKDAFIEGVILNTGFRKTDPDKLRRRFLNLLRQEHVVKTEKNKIVEVKKEANNFIGQICRDLWNESEGKIIDNKAQEEYWKERWGINKESLRVEGVKFTFFIVPALIDNRALTSNDYSLAVIEALIKKKEEWLNKKQIKAKLEKILGLGDNFNAYSNYFNEVIKTFQGNNGKEKILSNLEKIHLYKDSEKEEVNKALEFLSEKLKRLEPPQFPSINSWADYRSLVGGKIQSWFSNYSRRLEEMDKEAEGFLEGIKQVMEFLESKPRREEYNQNELEDKKASIKQYLEDLEKILEKKTFKENFQDYEDFYTLLGEARRELNIYWQKFYKVEKKGKNEEKQTGPEGEKLLRQFFKAKLDRPMNFYGTVQLEKNKKIVEKTIPILRDGYKITNQIIDSLFSTVSWKLSEEEGERNQIRKDAGLRRLLNILHNKIVEKALNSSQTRQAIMGILKNYASDNFIANPGKYTFYKNRYSTSNQEEITLQTTNYQKEDKRIIEALINILKSTDIETLLKDKNLLLDWVEVAKITLARLFRWQPKDEQLVPKWRIADFDFSNFEAAKTRIANIGEEKLTTKQLQYIINSLFFGEFRGTAVMFSKEIYRAKYSLQFIHSDEKLQLSLFPKDGDNLEEINKVLKTTSLTGKKRPAILPKIRWGVNLKSANIGNLPEINKVLIFDKKGQVKVQKTDNILNICTSFYHLQFLERLVYRPKLWQNIEISLMEPSLIVEENYKIDWDLVNGQPRILSHEPAKPRLFYVLPMQFEYKAKVPLLEKVKSTPGTDKFWLVGVDVGEYGLAWVAAKISEEKICVDNYGFINDPQVRKIHDRYADIQRKAKKGKFLEQSTVVAEVRKNAIGFLRNKLHSYLTELEDGGEVIYEASISNFETGSGRVTKIYDSVKKADVGNYPNQIDAYKKLVIDVWGLKRTGRDALPGWQVAAYASSYTCVRCGRSLYEITDDEKFTLKPFRDGNKIEKGKIIRLISQNDGRVWLGYLHKTDVEKTNGKTEIDGKLARKLIRNFARPPLGENSLVANTFIRDKIISSKRLNKIHKERGNSALFICPNPDCLSVADADIQAALIMAIRGYLRIKDHKAGLDVDDEKKNKGEKYDPKSFERSLELLRKIIKNGKLEGKLGFLYGNTGS